MKQTRILQNKMAHVVCIMFMSAMFIFTLNTLHAQSPARLGVQGNLKKGNGEAVEDGNYDLTFKLYTVPLGGTAIWDETQPQVEVISGIYSVSLGSVDSLDVAFNVPYYLGVTAGSTEMTPRIPLSSAPYALSLIGQTNQFPSTGQVIADSIDVNGNVLARSGFPGPNGANRNGFGFLGDKDSGLYSLENGQVSLYVNDTEEVKLTSDSMVINGEVRPQSIRLDNGGKVNYNGLDDWRLVHVEDFSSGTTAPNWSAHAPLPGNDWIGWNNSSVTVANVAVKGNISDYCGRFMVGPEVDVSGVAGNRCVLKRSYNFPTNIYGDYTYVKVKFKYHFLDTWDNYHDSSSGPKKDRGLAMVANNFGGTNIYIGWKSQGANVNQIPGGLNNLNVESSYAAGPDSDYAEDGEMTFRRPCTSGCTDFVLMFGARLDEVSSNENYGVGMIEIWVK